MVGARPDRNLTEFGDHMKTDKHDARMKPHVFPSGCPPSPPNHPLEIRQITRWGALRVSSGAPDRHNTSPYGSMPADGLPTTNRRRRVGGTAEGPKACGKTTTAMRVAASKVLPDIGDNTRRMIAVDLAATFESDTPRLRPASDQPVHQTPD